MIFMALNFVLENYFKDVLSLVDQSSDICDKILDCWFLSFNIYIYIFIYLFIYGLFRLNRLLLPMILGCYTRSYSVCIGPIWSTLVLLGAFYPL